MMARNPVDPALVRIAPTLRVPLLPRARPMNLARLAWPRRLMRWVGYLSARNLPSPGRQVHRDLRSIASADGRARLGLRIHRPEGLPSGSPALLWIHGGGYVMGAASIDDRLCALMATRAGLLVVAADYRLAPEHAYPVPLEDCYSALAWLHGHASELGVDASRIAIGGASAGGGLAAALALLARDRDGPKPAFQLLNYPMLDDRTTSSADSPRGEWVWGTAANRDCWSAYLGATAPAKALLPSRAASLAGLPPAWVGCGTLDLFHPECEAYAQRLRDSGVRCEWVSVERAYHGFDVSAPRAEISRDYFESQMRALREAFGL